MGVAENFRESSFSRSLSLARVLPVFVVGKALAIVGLLAGIAYHFNPAQSWNYLVFSDKNAGALLAFVNWDGQHYLRLALHGYPVPLDPSAAFYPLLPALIALGMQAGLEPIASGLAVVTLCSAMVFVLLQRLLPEHERSPSSAWLLASFPSAFYFSVVYSEALFIALFLGLLWALRDPRRAGIAFLCAAALPLARAQGFWLVIPIVAAWIALAMRGDRFGSIDRQSLGRASLGYLLGVLGYFAFFTWQYGHPLAGFAAQSLFVFHNSFSNLFDVPRFIDFMLRPPQRFFDLTNSGLDKLMILISLCALALGARRSTNAFLLASWACFAVFPAMMGEGGSYSRHALLAWVCFVLTVGPLLKPGFKWTLIVPSFAFQLYLAYFFGGNWWVG